MTLAAATSAPTPSPSASSLAPGAAASAPTDSPACPDYAPAFARGQAALARDQLTTAQESFEQAIRARPFDARAWSGLAHARFAAHENPLEAIAIARSLTRDRAAIAELWFLEGEALARDGSKDARLRHAVSAQMGHAPAAARLAGQSRCAATWATNLDRLPVLTNWRAALEAMPSAVCGEARSSQRTDAAARKEACRGCTSLLEPLDHEDHCTDAGPWYIPNGYASFHVFTVTIQSLGPGQLLVDELVEPIAGGFRRQRQAWSGVAQGTEVPAAQMRGEPDEQGCTPDVRADVDLVMPNHAQMGEALAPTMEPTIVSYWDKKGRGRLVLTTLGEPPTVTLSATEARITGQDCDATVPLPP